jgi:hypothetical protein
MSSAQNAAGAAPSRRRRAASPILLEARALDQADRDAVAAKRPERCERLRKRRLNPSECQLSR